MSGEGLFMTAFESEAITHPLRKMTFFSGAKTIYMDVRLNAFFNSSP
jgi:hypothetical protein